MKHLILIRHAKSCWDSNLIDLKRPINKRGIKDAELVSKELSKDSSLHPDLILVSNAERTKETAEIFIRNLKWDKIKTQLNSDLYDFSGESAFNLITSCPNHINTLVLFGHNPTFTLLASQLGSDFIDNIPTSGVIVISFNTEKRESIENGETIKIVFPRDLK
ncbi:histidine phosphatase family protein [Aurantibacter sp.]|uniref:SixA phosphatase family protein n=1 Tax=Aurantibacter sp. TaxID=2807103 RepID=UPI0035C87C65